MAPKVSVIIPCYNEERYLGRTLCSIEENKRSYPDIEVIVVCDSCTDRSAEVALRSGAKVFSVNARKPSVAKDEGASHAAGEFLIFLDADTTISRHAVFDIVESLRKRSVVGTLRIAPYPATPFALVMMFFKNVAFRAHFYAGFNGVIFCRASLFEKVGGFRHELYMKEDGEFMRQATKLAPYCFVSASRASTSIRRFQKLGYFGVMLFWIKVYISSTVANSRMYDAIR